MPPSSPSTDTVDRWHTTLRVFRFHRAVGGHAHDGDMLEGRLAFSGEAELVALFERMGRPLVVLPPDAKVPTPGASYTLDEYEALRQPLRAFPKYEAPGRTRLFGVSVYVLVGAGDVAISLSGADGDPYVVTERDVENARAIEAGLDAQGLLPPPAPAPAPAPAR